MKYFLISIILLTFSCKSETEKRKPHKAHNPYAEINQNIKNDTAIALYYGGLEKYRKMEYDSAMIYFESSLRIEPNPITYDELGTTSATQGKYRQAIDYFKKGRRLDSTYWPNYINESRTYLTLAEFEKGKNLLNKMIENCDSDYWISYANFYLALMYFNDGADCEKVKALLEKSKSMENDSDLKTQYVNFHETFKSNCDQ